MKQIYRNWTRILFITACKVSPIYSFSKLEKGWDLDLRQDFSEFRAFLSRFIATWPHSMSLLFPLGTDKNENGRSHNEGVVAGNYTAVRRSLVALSNCLLGLHCLANLLSHLFEALGSLPFWRFLLSPPKDIFSFWRIACLTPAYYNARSNRK